MEPEPEPAPAVDSSLESAPGIDASLEPAPAVEGKEEEEEEEMPPEEIYAQLRALCASINAKLGDTQAELHEHKMVKTALEPLEDERRCFRLMGTVLVEKSKGEVLPQILEQMTKVRA
jgi:prefoldin subunit 2